MNRFFSATLLGALLLFSSNPSLAQQAAVDPTKMVPSSTLASISLWPKDLAASPAMRLAPLEVISAAGLENIGIDPLKLSRVDVFIGMPGMNGPQLGAVIQSTEAIDVAQLNPEMFSSDEMIDDNGFKYMMIAGPEEIIVHPLNDKTLVVGTSVFAKAMVKSPAKQNDVASVINAIKSKQDALAVVSIKSLRPMLEGFAETAPLPPNLINDLNTVIGGVNFAALRILIGSEEKLQLVVSATDEASATNVEVSLANIIQFALDQTLEQMRTEMPPESQTSQAMLVYMERMSREITTGLKPTKSGTRLVYEVNDFQQASVVGTLTGLLLPAVQSARFSARRMQSSNNLKQLGLALYNFESAYKSFPAAGGVDDDGKPMLSWRVAILPFIEQAELYNRFNLDEPWDSEHNLALLDEMPETFKHPNRNTPPGYTVYQAPLNDQTLLRATEPTRIGTITDGTSNTIMLVETSEELAVPWTAPQDYALDMENPSLGLFVNGILTVLIGDGSVRTLEEASIDMDTLRALFTRAGGEVVDQF